MRTSKQWVISIALMMVLTLIFFGSAYALKNELFFRDSFLNMRDDAKDAAAEGKIFMVFYEQEACPYCEELHKKTLTDSAVKEYLQEHFHAVLVDIYGARETVGFHGEQAREKAFARRQGVHFTPTIVYYDGEAKELFRISGFWRPFHFLASMEYVRKGLYKEMNFQDYIREKASKSPSKI